MLESIEKLLSNNKVNGFRQVRRGIYKNQISTVLLADNADDEIKDKIRAVCFEFDIPLNSYPSKEELGNKLGLNVPCAVVGFIKE